MQPSPQDTFFDYMIMFNVIRIPTKFSKSIRRLNQKEKAELLDILMNIWDGIQSIPPNSQMWDIIELIYWEWMNMESRNWTKPKKSLIEAYSEWVGTEDPSESEHRVEYSRLEESIVEDIVIAPKVATLKEYIRETFDIDFIQEIYEKYPIWKIEFQEECNAFVLHWTEKSPNGKKEKWEMEKTFDPKLRFRTWMRNNEKWSKKNISYKPTWIWQLD